ncbi:MAG: hypothetical protein B0W54_03015 [Cellvibrio sp. 79]|nr:MAG: hypothetical protein B0W54_03015 [Cellvibrio sp. 79]
MLFSAIVVYVGFALLALNKNRHLQQIWPSRELHEDVKLALDTIGWLLLAVAVVYQVYISGFGNGLVEYTAVLSISGLILVFQFSYWPRSVLAIGLLERVTEKSLPTK